MRDGRGGVCSRSEAEVGAAAAAGRTADHREQALFVEQTLERALGMGDFAVEGELGVPEPSFDGKPPAGARSGSRWRFSPAVHRRGRRLVHAHFQHGSVG